MPIRDQKRATEKNSDEGSSSFSTLSQQSIAILSHPDLDQIFTQVVRQIKRIFKIKSCGLFLLNEKGFLKFRTGLGLSKRFQKAFDSQVSPNLTLKILNRTYPKISNDTLVDYKRNKDFRELLRSEGIHKEAATPLKIRNRFVGILNIWRDSSYPDFLEKDLKLLNIFGQQITAAIMNTELCHQLKRSSGRYGNLIEEAPDPIVVVDLKGHITYCNKATEILTGYQKDEVLGKHFSQTGLMDKKEAQYGLRLFKTARTGKKAVPFEKHAKRKDGKPYWVEIHATNVKEKGKVVGFQVKVRDVTERKKLEKALTRKERIATERARLLNDLRCLERIDHILTRVCKAVSDSGLFERAVMTLHKPGGKIVHLGQVGLPANAVKRARQAPPINGKLRAQITSKKFRISDSFFIPVEAGVDFTKSSRHIPEKRRDSIGGNWQPGDELFVPLRDFSGEIMGYLSVDTPPDGCRPDVKTIQALEMFVEAAAARVREVEAHLALKRERDLSQSILETANSLIVCLDADAKITAFNRECERITGYRREEVLGKRWPELFLPPDKRHPKLKSFAKWVRAHPRDQYEGPILTKSGEIRTILWSNTAILGSGKKDVAAIAIGQDITERKRAEEELRESGERYRSVVDNIGIGVSLISPNMEILSLNNQMKSWFPDIDVSKKPLCYRSFNDPPREGVCSYCPTYKTLKDGQVHESITETPAADEIRNYRIISSPIRDKAGKVIAAIEMVEDITERRQTEEELRISQERYELSTRAAKVGVWDWDIKTNKFYIDPNIKDILGYNDKEIPNDIKIWVTYVHPDDREPVMAAAQACLDGKTPEYVFEHRMVHKDGSIRWILSRGNVIRNAKGNAVRMVGTDTDITERKSAEKALQISENKHKTLLENLPQKIFLKDRNSVYLSCNENLAQDLKIKAEKIAGKTDYDFVPKELAEKYRADDKRIMDSGKTEDIEERYVQDGHEVFIHTVKTPVKDEQGNVIGLLGIFWDITERKRAEEALQKSEDQLRLITDSLPVLISYVDAGRRYRFNNKAYREWFGHSHKEVYGKHIKEVLGKSAYKSIERYVKTVLSGQEVTFQSVIPYKDAGTRYVNASYVPHFGEQGKVKGFFALVSDITESKRAEQAQRESEKRYRSLFEDSPISLWEEDFSKVKTFIDGLRAKRVKDFRKYFENHPEAVTKCATMVKVTDVNNASLKLFKAKRKEELQRDLSNTFSEESYDAFREELVALARGENTFETEALTRTLKGDKKHVVIRWSVAPGREKSLSKVLVSIGDITELKRAKEQNLLLKTSKALSQTLKFERVLKIGTKRMAKTLEADRCSVALFDERGDSAAIKHVFTEMGSSSLILPGKRTPPDEHFSKVKEILLTKGYLAIENVETVPMPSSVRSYLRGVGTKSFLAIPLIVDRKLFGVFHIGSVKKLRRFTPEEISLAQTIANQVAVAIQNALLMEDLKEKHSQITQQSKTLERQFQEQAILMKISRALSQTLDLDRILEIATRETVQALQVDRCAVALAFPEEGYAEIRSIYVKERKPVTHLIGYRLYSDQLPQARKMFEKRKSINIPNIHHLPDKSFAKKYFARERIKSALFTPMVHGKKVVGFFVISTMKEFKTFTSEETRLAQTIADQVAVAIENAKLLELVKKNEENLKTLSAQLINVQEDERKKLAQKLHGEVGQLLFAMKMNLDMTKKTLPINIEGFEDMNSRLSDTENLLSETIDQIRNLTTDLRPSVLDDFGLIPALKWYIENFSKRTNVKVYLKIKNFKPRLPSEVETTLYRILQEALTNVAKHAQATEVSILLRRENHLASLAVEDNGIGFETKKIIPAKDRFGLFSIKEMVELLNGKFEIRSKSNKGTKLIVKIPFTEERV